MIRRIAALFSGQGSVYMGMYKALYEESQIVQDTIKEAEEISGIPISELVFQGPITKLANPLNNHVIIHAFGVAAFRDYMNKVGIAPTFCAGHSLGEYTALACAGVISYKDSIMLVQKRSELSVEVQKNFDGGMTIVDGIDRESIEFACRKQQKSGKKVYISCLNSETQTAISGVRDDIDETEDLLLRSGNGTVSPLLGSAPFHCPMMEDMSVKLEKLLNTVEFHPFRYPVMSNYTGKVYSTEPSEIKKNLIKHLIEPVQWNSIMEYFGKLRMDLLIDFSSKNMFQYFTNLTSKCYGTKKEREEIQNTFQNAEYIKHKPDFLSKCILAVVSTPNKNNNNFDYEERVIGNYKLLTSYKQVINSDGELHTEDKKKILDLLKEILNAKGILEFESKEMINRILDETGSRYEIVYEA